MKGFIWRRDILSWEHDRCFICDPLLSTAWLGRSGPGIEGQLLNFLKDCRLYGKSIAGQVNQHATENSPIVYRRDDLAGPLHVGLHLETDDPAELATIIRGCMHTENCQDVPILRPEPRHKRTVSRC